MSHTPNDPARDEHLLPDRQHRLLACGLCRQVAPYIDRPELFAVLEAAEAFVDGRLSAAELVLARQFAADIARAYAGMPEQEKFASAVVLAATVVPRSSRTLYKLIEPAAATLIDRSLRGVLDLLADRGAELPRVAGYAELFDDVEPRQMEFSCDWRTHTAIAIARGMYETREFSAMPILADAIQDAGCDNEVVLAHCRDLAQVHVRGCWVVDRVLGII